MTSTIQPNAGASDFPALRSWYREGKWGEYDLALDFKNGVYRSNGVPVASLSAIPSFTYTRAGAKIEFSPASARLPFAANTPAVVADLGYICRTVFTNLLPNSVFNGGTTGTPGVGPSFTTLAAPAGLSRTLTYSTVSGLTANSINIRHNGTTAAGGNTNFAFNLHNSFLTVTPGETVSFSAFSTIIGGSVANLSLPLCLQLNEYNGSSFVTASRTNFLTNSNARLSLIKQLSATTNNVLAFVNAEAAPETTVDFTYSIAMAQFNRNPVPGPLILTSGAAASAGPDTLRVPLSDYRNEDSVIVLTINMVNSMPSSRPMGLTLNNASRFNFQAASGSTVSFGGVNKGLPYGTIATSASLPTTGRFVLALIRQGGKLSAGLMLANNTVAYTAAIESPTGFADAPFLDIGHAFEGAWTDTVFEFVGYRKGTFTTAEITAMMTKALA